ncbi:hypothetical protein K2173_020376 [Erythroxylum novogranatense]|uniref:DUF547 domain-containing protein n=1 Tax=Erythroxylum novogranatense TaxID=1862640 RepID=A0AAV8TI01_9ROSI|nr:hypothetical protein K2173_020376 [Erythroxylum novogranatense]
MPPTIFQIVTFRSFFPFIVVIGSIMKFEDYLMQPGDENQTRVDLEEEVDKLQGELDEEKAVRKVLQSALHGPIPPHLPFFLPPLVQGLLIELTVVEEEIVWLEKKVEELKLSLYLERKQTKEWKVKKQQRGKPMQHSNLQPLLSPGKCILSDDFHELSRSQHFEDHKKEKIQFRRVSAGSATEILSFSSPGSTKENSRRHSGRTIKEQNFYREIRSDKPNELSEELLGCLIGLFLDLNQAPQDREIPATVPKLNLSCMNPKGSKTLFNCKASLSLFNQNVSNLDPYGIIPDLDGTIRDIGPYKNFIQITRNSLDVSQFSESSPMARKFRNLLQRLGNTDLTFLTYKQKLSFWINVYNSCIMHAFLENGLPSSQENLLKIMKKASLNVGGIVLNALAIEHFILRHRSDSEDGPVNEKEMLLRRSYGLGYPEPNVTFALCRGSWSSPALRVYTPDEVINELGTAKVEYLEASVGVTSKRKIVVPKLLQWNMRDFADDMESMLEWIYSQLPRSGSLKRLMMECFNGEKKSRKLVEIQPYEYEFRYLLPL